MGERAFEPGGGGRREGGGENVVCLLFCRTPSCDIRQNSDPPRTHHPFLYCLVLHVLCRGLRNDVPFNNQIPPRG